MIATPPLLKSVDRSDPRLAAEQYEIRPDLSNVAHLTEVYRRKK
ncbi:hypothetical protein [Microvirga lotononidis]|uniref:Uncharacterized protein n=1 Tax=Microvirga lotononidis TaxID=864069 RepID=I4YQX1_9HYPH|nr:hypothetical protein [Microvirga lotononidis]EIM26363.1 hypothetical protein MicloDRAFT_00029120 [Microvirga lotononidis]WQO30729.1 hypothetical protein U0023_25225 [Microvirga lotononidis]